MLTTLMNTIPWGLVGLLLVLTVVLVGLVLELRDRRRKHQLLARLLARGRPATTESPELLRSSRAAQRAYLALRWAVAVEIQVRPYQLRPTDRIAELALLSRFELDRKRERLWAAQQRLQIDLSEEAVYELMVRWRDDLCLQENAQILAEVIAAQGPFPRQPGISYEQLRRRFHHWGRFGQVKMALTEGCACVLLAVGLTALGIVGGVFPSGPGTLALYAIAYIVMFVLGFLRGLLDYRSLTRPRRAATAPESAR